MKSNIHSIIKNLSKASLTKFKKSILNKKDIIKTINKRRSELLDPKNISDPKKISFKINEILKEKLSSNKLKLSSLIQYA